MVGLIAQELGDIFPQAVNGDPAGDVDEEPMTVIMDDLVPLLIKSVQDQQTMIKKLEKRWVLKVRIDGMNCLTGKSLANNIVNYGQT